MSELLQTLLLCFGPSSTPWWSINDKTLAIFMHFTGVLKEMQNSLRNIAISFYFYEIIRIQEKLTIKKPTLTVHVQLLFKNVLTTTTSTRNKNGEKDEPLHTSSVDVTHFDPFYIIIFSAT